MSSYSDFAPKTMTDNTTPSPYVASSPSSYTTFLPWRCFDSNETTSYWLGTAGPPRSFTIDMGAVYVAYDYAVKVNTIPEPNRAPKDWTFEGSLNGSDWTVLDTVTNQTTWSSGQVREFACDVISGFRYFKLSITDNNGDATYTQCASFYIYGYKQQEPLDCLWHPRRNRMSIKGLSLGVPAEDDPILTSFISLRRNRFQRTGVSDSGYVLSSSPWSFSGLLWGIKADDLAGSENDLIASVPDKGPSGYTLTQTTDGNKPHLHLNEINGRKALYFDGDDKMNNATATNLKVSIFTFWAVVSHTVDGSLAIVQIGPGGAGSGRYLRFTAGDKASLLNSSTEIIGETTAIIPEDGSWHTIIVSHNATTGAYQFYVDSVVNNSGTKTTIYSATGTNLTLGWTPDGSTPEYLTGYIAEAGMLDHIITASEMSTLASYFEREYGL